MGDDLRVLRKVVVLPSLSFVLVTVEQIELSFTGASLRIFK